MVTKGLFDVWSWNGRHRQGVRGCKSADIPDLWVAMLGCVMPTTCLMNDLCVGGCWLVGLGELVGWVEGILLKLVCFLGKFGFVGLWHTGRGSVVGYLPRVWCFCGRLEPREAGWIWLGGFLGRVDVF